MAMKLNFAVQGQFNRIDRAFMGNFFLDFFEIFQRHLLGNSVETDVKSTTPDNNACAVFRQFNLADMPDICHNPR